MLSSKTVLVVEDESTIRRFTSSVLKQQLNCKNVMQAASAEEGLELLSGAKVDLILSDWEMPGMNGDELLFNVRMDPALKETPFVMVTCRSDKDALITAIQAGVSEYIVKPFSAATLVQKIRRTLNQADKRAMPRVDAKENRIEVNVVFGPFHSYKGDLHDLSQTGCLARCPLFKHGIKGVYEKVELTIRAPGKPITMQAEISRMTMDTNDPPSVLFMMAGFQFDEIDPANGDRIRKFMRALSAKDLSLYTQGFVGHADRTKEMLDL
jgi:CheY-like chemotaxis protein